LTPGVQNPVRTQLPVAPERIAGPAYWYTNSSAAGSAAETSPIVLSAAASTVIPVLGFDIFIYRLNDFLIGTAAYVRQEGRVEQRLLKRRGSPRDHRIRMALPHTSWDALHHDLVS